MTGRAAAVRNRLLIALVAGLLGWFFGWTSDEGLVMLVVGIVALVLALLQAWCGGIAVLGHWLFRYRHVDIGLRQLGDLIGEHSDDMHRAGLVVPRGTRSSVWAWWRPKSTARPLPDLVPRLRHRPYDGGIVLSLEAVRAGMSQEDLLRAVPRLRSAWGVDVVRADAKPGGRLVEFTIPMTDEARRAVVDEPDPVGARWTEPAGRRSVDEDRFEPMPAPARGAERREPVRPPDGRTVTVVQAGGRERSSTAPRPRPPSIQPQLTPDDHGRYELTMLPADAARTFSPRPMDQPAGDDRNPSTAEIPVIEAPSGTIAREPARPPSAPPRRSVEMPNPTAIDERELRLGPHWRVGKER